MDIQWDAVKEEKLMGYIPKIKRMTDVEKSQVIETYHNTY